MDTVLSFLRLPDAVLDRMSLMGDKYVNENFTCEHYARKFLTYAKEAIE